MTAAKSY